jgi:hypothetical protein
MIIKKITVSAFAPTKIECQWVAGSKLEDGWFDAETLEPAPPKEQA